MFYYATGESIYDEDIYTDNGPDEQSLATFTRECHELLTELGGGHLDIFNEEDKFIKDVEV